MRLIFCLLLLAVSGTSLAQSQWNETKRRAGAFEFTVGGEQLFSTSADGRNGSAFDIEDAFGFRGGFDWYFSDRVSLGFDMTIASPDYDAVLVTEDGRTIEGSAESDVFTGQLNLAYYFMEGALTPFAEASIGWTYFDTNIVDGAPNVGCWWDPWWGYVCSDFYSTYDETSFSYGLAAGLSWDFGYNMFVKGSYRWLQADVSEARSDPDLNSLAVEIGWRF